MGEFLNGRAVGPDSSSVAPRWPRPSSSWPPPRSSCGPTLEHGDPAQQAENEFWYEALYSRAASVYRRRQQIQRNIIADRVLALPQE